MVTHHNLCFSHSVSDYVHAWCCAECLRWQEEVITLCACYSTSASPLRLVHSLLFFLLLLPPQCSLHNPFLSDISYLMIPIYDAYSISYVYFCVSQLSLCVNYNTLTVDGFCKAIISSRMQNPLTDFCIWQPCCNPLRTVWLLSAPSDPSTRNSHFPVLSNWLSRVHSMSVSCPSGQCFLCLPFRRLPVRLG